MIAPNLARLILQPPDQDEVLRTIATPAMSGHIPPEVSSGVELVAVPEAAAEGIRCRLMPRTAAVDLVRVERQLVLMSPAAQAVEYELCRQSREYFIGRWLDIETKFPLGRDRTVPFTPFPYQVRIIRLYDQARAERRGIFEEKSRQLGLSWLWMALFLHGLLFEEQESFFATSRREDEVDDGGSGSTTRSLFGRVRFMYDRLALTAPFLHRSALKFKFLSISHLTSGTYLNGEAATPNIGRGGSYTCGLLDEFAHVEQSESAWASADEAIQCPIQSSTPQGEDNKFANVRDQLAKPKSAGDHEVRKRFLAMRSHWSEHPIYARGIARDADGNLTSPWYRRACSTKTPEKAAQEYDIAYAGSLPGRFLPEFSRGVHVPTEPIALHTGLWFYLSADHGLSDTEVWQLWQTDGEAMADLVAEWHTVPEGSHHGADLTSAEVAASIVQWLAGMHLSLGRLEGIIADPSGAAREQTTGQSHHELLKATWTRLGQSIPNWYPANNSIVDGIESTRLLMRGTYNGRPFRLRVSPRCTLTIDSLVNYRRRITRDGRVLDQEHKDWTNHACLTGDTLVDTTDGPLPIRDVRPGMTVYTTAGPRRVLAAGMTGRQRPVYRVRTVDGRSFRCTADHPILTEYGWKNTIDFSASERIITVDTIRYAVRAECPLNSYGSTAADTAGMSAPGTTKRPGFGRVDPRPTSTGTSGSSTTAPSDLSTRSTTSTATRKPPTFPGWSSFLRAAIRRCTGSYSQTKSASDHGATSGSEPFRRLSSGTAAMLAGNGTPDMAVAASPSVSTTSHATSADRASSGAAQSPRGVSAPTRASLRGAEPPESTTRCASAPTAEATSRLASTSRSGSVPGPAPTTAAAATLGLPEFAGYADVYNLHIEDLHEFAVEGGLIVHNCDSFRYFCHTVFPAIGDVAVDAREPEAYTDAVRGRI